MLPGGTPLTVEPRDMTRVWDLPIRLWHWLFGACVVFSLYTGLAGDFSLMEWHQWSGYTIVALLLFRVGWGLWGGRYVRFRHYVTTPRDFLAHFVVGLRSKTPAAGVARAHTAPGIALVVLLFLGVAVQVTTGLFATDDMFINGPLRGYVDEEVASAMNWVHHRAFWLVIALVSTHLVAHAVYGAMRDPTPLAMITGRKAVDLPVTKHYLLRGAATIAVTGGFVYVALRLL